MSIGDFVRLVIDTIDKGDPTEAKRMLRNWMVHESQPEHPIPVTVNNSQRQNNVMLVGAIGGWVVATIAIGVLAFSLMQPSKEKWSQDAIRKNQETGEVSVESIRPRQPERVD